jgi:hypothetical protein
VFHNLKNYDTRHIFRNFNKRIAAKYDKKGRQSYRSVHIIALNLEKYISFEIQHLRFIDSYQFLNSSLEKLVKNLPTGSLRHARKYLGSNELLFAKGIFPYEWFDSFEKFDGTELPPKEAFYSQMNEEGITDDEYWRAQKIWTAFDCQTFKDYHDLYLKTDALLLSDVFENFRDVSMANYCLDPAVFDVGRMSEIYESRIGVNHRSGNISFLRERNAGRHFDDQQSLCAGQQPLFEAG